MPAFVWKGKNREGKAVSGEQSADTKEAVMAVLRRQQILVSSVKEKGKEVALPKLSGSVQRWLLSQSVVHSITRTEVIPQVIAQKLPQRPHGRAASQCHWLNALALTG